MYTFRWLRHRFALYVQTSGHKCRRVQTSVVYTNQRRVLPIRRKIFNLSALCTFACNWLIITWLMSVDNTWFCLHCRLHYPLTVGRRNGTARLVLRFRESGFWVAPSGYSVAHDRKDSRPLLFTLIGGRADGSAHSFDSCMHCVTRWISDGKCWKVQSADKYPKSWLCGALTAGSWCQKELHCYATTTFSLVIWEMALSWSGYVTENAAGRCARDNVFNI